MGLSSSRVPPWTLHSYAPSSVSFELRRMYHQGTRSKRNQRALSMISMDSFPCRIKSEMSSINDTIYLCNFRVSVDGDWLCLKELHELQSCEFPSRPPFFREEYGLSSDCLDFLQMCQSEKFTCSTRLFFSSISVVVFLFISDNCFTKTC